MIRTILTTADETIINAVDDLVRSLQYRFRIRYGVILSIALALAISMTWFAARTSFSDIGNPGLVLFNDLIFGLLTILAAIGFWRGYASSLKEMSVPVYEIYAHRAVANRLAQGVRFGLFCIMLFGLALQLPAVALGGNGLRSFSKAFLAAAPFLLFLYFLCSLPIISQHKLQEFFREIE